MWLGSEESVILKHHLCWIRSHQFTIETGMRRTALHVIIPVVVPSTITPFCCDIFDTDESASAHCVLPDIPLFYKYCAEEFGDLHFLKLGISFTILILANLGASMTRLLDKLRLRRIVSNIFTYCTSKVTFNVNILRLYAIVELVTYF